MIRVQWQDGVWLPDVQLALDPHTSRPWAFVSHAHSDHARRHDRTLLTPATAALLAQRQSRSNQTQGRSNKMPGQQEILDYGVSRTLEELGHSMSGHLHLLPAGHILGSAQLFLETDGGSLLYTGDFKIRSGRSCPPAEFCVAETLVMETTFGLPRYVFPPTDEVMGAIVDFCRESLEDGDRPVLLGYSMGKSQEVLAALEGAGLSIFLHESVERLTRVYRELGVALPTTEVFRATEERPGVLLGPPSLRASRLLEQLPRRRVAFLSGWALDPSARYRWGCDAVFPLSDHADYPGLLAAVEMVRPRRVLTLHGFAAEFARDLRERGLEAYALNGPDQLDLGLSGVTVAVSETPSPTPAPAFLQRAGFGRFCLACEEIATRSGQRAKVRVAADFLRKLRGNELSRCALWLTGRPFPRSEEQVLGLGNGLLRRALEEVAGKDGPQVRPIARRLGDLGRAATEILPGKSPGQVAGKRLEIADVQALFYRLSETGNSLASLRLLTEWIGAVTPLEACYLIRLCAGNLRIGLGETLVEEALAEALGRDLVALRETHQRLGDLGKTALLARQNRLPGIRRTSVRVHF